MRLISSSECLTKLYEAWSWLLHVWSLLQFGTQRITTTKVGFGNSGWLPLALMPVCTAKSVTGHLKLCLLFLLTSRTSLAQFFNHDSIYCCRIHLALSKFSKCSQVSEGSKISGTAVTQCREPSRSCFRWRGLQIIARCSFCKNPGTHRFFHVLKVLKLGCHILLANCFKENFFYFKLIGGVPSPLPKSDKSWLL